MRAVSAAILTSVLLASTAAAQAPPNDARADATPMAGYGVYTGTSVGATSEPGEAAASCVSSGQNDSGRSVWWTFTAAGSGVATVDASRSDVYFNTVLSIHDASGAEVACNDNTSGGLNSRIADVPLETGQTYWVRVSGVGYGASGGNEEGGILLWLDDGAGPPNDDVENATPLTADGFYDGLSVGATRQDGEPSASCVGLSPDNDYGNSVWWSFTASEGGEISVDMVEQSGFSPVMSIHTPDLTELACDSGLGAISSPRIDNLAVEAGQTYLVRVVGFLGGEGAFTLQFAGGAIRPPNDDRAQATPLVANGSYTGNNQGATLEPGEALASCTAGGPSADTGTSIWWTYTAPADAQLTFSPYTGFFGVMTIEDAQGTELACSDDADATTGPLIAAFPIQAGQTVWVRVSGRESPFGSDTGVIYMRFDASAALVNDAFADAVTIEAPGVYTGTTEGATLETGEALASCVRNARTDEGRSAWWRYTAPQDGALSVSLAGSSFDTVLSFHDADRTETACNDQDSAVDPVFSFPGETSRISNVAVAQGETVWIRVSGRLYEYDGSVTLTLDLLPPSSSVNLSGTTVGGPRARLPLSAGEAGGCTNNHDTVAYQAMSLTVPTSGFYSLLAEWEDFSGCLHLYASPFDPAQMCENHLVGNCDLFGGAGTSFVSGYPLEAGAEYVLVASGVSQGDEGAYTAEVFGPFVPTLRLMTPVSADAGAPTEALDLTAPRPNPASGRVAMTLALPTSESVTVAVFDALGRRVAVVHDGPLDAGPHVLAIEAGRLPAGVYVVRATGASFSLRQRLTVAR